jgi:hypothetical protein
MTSILLYRYFMIVKIKIKRQLLRKPPLHSSVTGQLARNRHVRKILRRATWTQILLVFLCLQTNNDTISSFQIATACFSCRHPDSKSSKSNGLLWLPPNYATQLTIKTKILRSLPTVVHLTYSLKWINKCIHEHPG